MSFKNSSFFVLFGILFLVLSLPLFLAHYGLEGDLVSTGDFIYTQNNRSPEEYQEILLRFYTQELVAHGAMLFASSVAAFTFVTGFINARKNDNRFWRSIIFVLFSGLLLGITIYTGFRLLHYGVLTNDILRFDTEPLREHNNTLETFTEAFSEKRFERHVGLFKNLLIKISRGLPTSPDLETLSENVFFFSIYSGLFSAYLIFYAFGYHSVDSLRDIKIDKKIHRRNVFWFLYFVVPVISGIVGVMSDYPVWVTTISGILTILIPLWYIGLLAVWCWWTKMISKDQAIGGSISLMCVVIAIIYIVLLLGAEWMEAQGWVTWNPDTVRFWVIAVPVFIAFVAVMGIGAWIGWTIATTPSPKSIEEIRKEEDKTK